MCQCSGRTNKTTEPSVSAYGFVTPKDKPFGRELAARGLCAQLIPHQVGVAVQFGEWIFSRA
jgi:hypothetical protein